MILMTNSKPTLFIHDGNKTNDVISFPPAQHTRQHFGVLHFQRAQRESVSPAPFLCSVFGSVPHFLSSCLYLQQSPLDPPGSLVQASSYLLLSAPPFPQNFCKTKQRGACIGGVLHKSLCQIYVYCLHNIHNSTMKKIL